MRNDGYVLRRRCWRGAITSLVERNTGLWGPKHSHDLLREALTQVHGDKRFGESKCRLVIPTYDAIGGRVFLLKTAHHERFKYDYKALAVSGEHGQHFFPRTIVITSD